VILDTNALSAWAEGFAPIEAPLRSAQRLVVPSIVLGEYYFGVRLSRHRPRYEEWLRLHLQLAEVATVTSATADVYAEIRLQLRRAGTPIPLNDAWIAALCRQHALPVLSNDAHFDAVAGVHRIAF
jgi:predicted nucleic acid-binding protein